MKNEDAISVIKQHVDNLQKLLAQPDVNMISWASQFGQEMTWLTTYWKKGIQTANLQESDPHTCGYDLPAL